MLNKKSNEGLGYEKLTWQRSLKNFTIKIPLVRNITAPIINLKKAMFDKNYYQERNVFVNDNENAIYFFIPKVACTSLKTVLMELGYERVILKAINPKKYSFRFTFVRNPYDRLVSAYKDKVRKPCETGVISYNYKLLKEDMSFKDFVRAVHKTPDDKIDRHFRSQYWSLKDDEGGIYPDFIGKFENIQEDYKKLMNNLGIENPPELPHRRNSKKGNYMDYYDEETKKLVYERYYEDFKLGGYEK